MPRRIKGLLSIAVGLIEMIVLAFGLTAAALSVAEVPISYRWTISLVLFVVFGAATAFTLWKFRPGRPVHVVVLVLVAGIVLIPHYVPYYARESVRNERTQ